MTCSAPTLIDGFDAVSLYVSLCIFAKLAFLSIENECAMSHKFKTIVVDLDDTLIKTDLLFEGMVRLFKSNILYLLLVPFWLVKGRLYCKKKIAAKVSIRADLLPYNQELITWLKQKKQQGLRLVLVTASLQCYADAVNEHLALFDAAYGSDTHNLKGVKKAEFIEALLSAEPFAYVGDSLVDCQVWRHAEAAVCVNASAKTLAKAKACSNVIETFCPSGSRLKSWLKAIRVHQYVKNTLLFLPMLLGHFLSGYDFLVTFLGFVCFCLMASSVYLLNDLMDLEHDRAHQKKSQRPFASGQLSIVHGLGLTALLLVIAMVMSLWLPWSFQIVILVYYALTLLYSLNLKSVLLVDVFTLACLYTLRIVAGIALGVAPYSTWLLMFSIFFFYSLALVKRYSELFNLAKRGVENIAGRAYHIAQIPVLMNLGVVSGVVACLVFGLYISSAKAAMMYSNPNVLYGVCIVLLFWISRIWLLASDGKVNEDPILFAIKDKVSLVSCAVIVAIVIFSVW